MSDVVIVALLGAAAGIVGSVLTYLATRERMRNEANQVANDQLDKWYARLIEDNERLQSENRLHEDRLASLERAAEERAREHLELQRRLGTYEADLARLQRENASLRQEIDRMANELLRERTEKQLMSSKLVSAERTKRDLERRVVDLERQVTVLETRVGRDHLEREHPNV